MTEWRHAKLRSTSIDGQSMIWRGLNSISTRFVLLIILFITAVYSVIAFHEIKETSSRLENELRSEAQLLAEVHAEALADALWNLNVDSVRRQLNLLITNRNLLSAEVREPDDTVFAVAKSEPAADQSETRLNELLPLAQPIRMPDGEIIGSLNLLVSRDRINAEHTRHVLAHIQDFSVIALVIILVIVLAVSSLVRPIIDITRTMTKLAEGKLDTVIPGVNRRDEIGDMARALEVFKSNAEYVQHMLEKERELSGLQRQFVSMVSHEFRTPLAVIDGHAQRLLRRIEKLDVDQLRKGLNKVRRSVSNLTDLMESVLNAAHLEEGQVEFKPDPCPLHSLLNELCSSYGEINGDRRIILEIDELPDSMMADRRLLRQVISNLLSNAIKYSPDGLNIWVTGKINEHDEVVISVRDEGLGIPPDELEKLFNRFFRASTSTGIAGSGIGLHLVRHFVELHDGRIEVESTVNVGTNFSVYLPFRHPVESVASRAA